MVTDKIAIVTGSSRGIGFGIALKLAQSGANVVCTATTQEGAEKAAQKINAETGRETLGIKADVSVLGDVQNLVKAVMDKFGRIDIVVNNAGITRDNLLMRMSEEEWQTVLNVNLNSVFYLTKSVIRPMLKQKYGRIINIASVVGVVGNPGQANYAAAKAGVIGFTKTIAKEVGAKGITCNAVAPGFINTDMIKSLPEEYLNNIINMVPQKRVGEVEDIAGVVNFLASDSASYITGQVINVDGGMVI
ncbi:3-oxoacyl-ACP reductase FabG [Thermoproteota archaeon]